MDILLEPNVAYLILVAGVMLGFMAIVSPGTGLFEVGAFFCLLLAGYAVYNLSFNWWALMLLVLSLVPFVYAIRKPGRELFLILSIVLLTVGSVFLFPDTDEILAVNPILAITASLLMAIFLWIAVRKSMEAATIRPSHDLDALVGKVGEARTKVFDDGSVQVGGELWSARSEKSIPAGSQIRVIRREGFVVIVEEFRQSGS
jgi:membrane-bound serine protease (ClpP class)